MSGIDLNAITENASRLGTRLQEAFSEHTRDLAIARGSSAAYLDNPDDKVKNIRKQLDSSSDREKLDAMKRLIALISKGRNVSEYFAQVVKNVASHNLEIRKLVYIYLLRYAEQEPDLALLSINTFQKDLSDSNPLIRAMALRVLSGIKVPMIGSIVVLAIKKCASDISPYVRKAAAQAIPKCYGLDASHQPELITILSTLLRDRSPLSLGSVAVAFEAVCPTRLDLLHQHYRRLCRTLLDMDEWGQADLLVLLTRYARTMLPRPIESPDNTEEEVDPDLKLLFTSSEPLFQSSNPAVVLAVGRAFYYLAPPSELKKIVSPLIRLLHISPEVERVVLTYLLIISKSHSSLLAPSYTSFLVRSNDISVIKRDKMLLLRSVISPENHQALLREFIHYADDSDDVLVTDAIRAIGYCARLVPDSTQQCLTALMAFIQSPHDIVVANAVLVLKSLVQIRLHQAQTSFAPTTGVFSPMSIISRLAYRIDEIRHPKARACVIWLVGQYASSSESSTPGGQNGVPTKSVGPEGLTPWAADVLRKSAANFAQETPVVKLQIVTLAAKLLVLCPTDRTLILLTRYVLTLARYDLNFDVRDRARTIGSLLAGVTSALRGGEEEFEEQGGVVLRREQVKMVLFEGKKDVADDTPTSGEGGGILGSLGAITGRHMLGESYLPDWLEEGTESSLRDTEDDTPQVPVYAQNLASAAIVPRSIASSSKGSPVVLTPTGSASPAGSYVPQGSSKAPWADLDSFYADTNTDEGEEEEEEEEEDGEETEEEETEEEGEEEEENDEGPGESDEDGEDDDDAESQETDHAARVLR
ncbi:adaptin N terminal region-domain-containing protein [Abortiporus biennis]|nr:adaptin N terminal region-domain-containing protein [Abortiporus biennis]